MVTKTATMEIDTTQKKEVTIVEPEPEIIVVVTFAEFVLNKQLEAVLSELESIKLRYERRALGPLNNVKHDEMYVLQSNVKVFSPPLPNTTRRKRMIELFKRHDFVLEASESDRVCFGFCHRCLASLTN